MELTGTPLLVLIIAITVAFPVVLFLLWSRVRGPRALRVLQRLALVLGCQLSAVALVALALNDQFIFYDSWSDLLGLGQNVTASGLRADAPQGASWTPRSQGHPFGLPDIPPGQRLVGQVVTGPRSGVRAKLWALVPQGYTDRAQATRRYPVVMFLPGYPGEPGTWTHVLHVESEIDAQVAAGKMPPVIAVLPVITVAPPRDTECTDVPQGPQVDTWLGVDVPNIIASEFRTLPPGPGWAVTGYSTGGFCAAKLLLRHPEAFGAAASIAGYYQALTDPTTGDLFGGSPVVRAQNDPVSLASSHAVDRSMLVVWSVQDRDSAGSTRTFLAAAHPPLRVDELRLAQGGHNPAVWLSVLPQVLGWLGAHLQTKAAVSPPHQVPAHPVRPAPLRKSPVRTPHPHRQA